MSTRTTMSAPELRLIDQQRVGHLATADAHGAPHVVPVCFAYDGKQFFIALDEKPKHVPDAQLKRVRNLVANSSVALTIDLYDEDWSRLSFVLVSGHASLLSPGALEHNAAVALLRERYPQYRAMLLERRQIIAVRPTDVTSWRATTPESHLSVNHHLTKEVPTGRGIDFLSLARARRSVRRYQTRAVEQEHIRQVLEAACWAPSPHGRQPWRFVVLTSSERKSQLAAAMGEEWQRILAMDGQPTDVVTSRLRISHERILQAPAVILACLYLADLDEYPDPHRQEAERTMAVQSLGAAIQNLLLAAYAQGLDAGWMCAPLFCAEVVRDAFSLPTAYIPHALLTLGYAAVDPIRRSRLPIEEMVTFLE